MNLMRVEVRIHGRLDNSDHRPTTASALRNAMVRTSAELYPRLPVGHFRSILGSGDNGPNSTRSAWLVKRRNSKMVRVGRNRTITAVSLTWTKKSVSIGVRRRWVMALRSLTRALALNQLPPRRHNGARWIGEGLRDTQPRPAKIKKQCGHPNQFCAK
jgi:hypothetical protein